MPITGVGGVSVHAELTGLSADDHSQYLIGDDSRTSDSVSVNIINLSSTTDPSSPVEGTLWYNSTDKQYKGYNGTSVVLLG